MGAGVGAAESTGAGVGVGLPAGGVGVAVGTISGARVVVEGGGVGRAAAVFGLGGEPLSQNQAPAAAPTTSSAAATKRGTLLVEPDFAARLGAAAPLAAPARGASVARAGVRTPLPVPWLRNVRTTWRRYDKSFGRQSGPFSRQPMTASVRSRGTSGLRSERGEGRSGDGLRPESIS